MKTMRIILIAMVAIFMNFNVNAQDKKTIADAGIKTATYNVSGNCESCKARIEKAAKLDGVNKADWNTDTKLLTLTYVASKVKPEDVLKKISAAGYDNEKFKADDKAYGSLPGCCKYRSK